MAFKMKGFKAHDMFNPKTGEKHRAKVKADHDRMDKLGYTHEDESPAKEKPQFKSKVKKRGDKTIVKTKEKGSNYRSKIVLDEEGNIIKAKNTETKNKSKKDPRRTKRSKWIDRDLAGYRNTFGKQ